MKALRYILVAVFMLLPLLVCIRMIDADALPDWIWAPLTVLPFFALYVAGRTGHDTLAAIAYYGTWAVVVWLVAGTLAFFNWKLEPLAKMMKTGAVLFLLALTMQALRATRWVKRE